MRFLHHFPGPPLSDFVEMLWLYEGFTISHTKERLLPTGTVDLVVNLREDQPDFRTPIVVGPHSAHSLLDTSLEASVIGVHFKPGGAAPFIGAPLDELHNLDVSLDLLWSAGVQELRDRILAAPTAPAMFQVLERALLRAARSFNRHTAVAYALRHFEAVPHAQTIAQVARAVGFSERHFIKRFREEVGLTPKLFCRVRRFQEVVRMVHRATEVNWTEVAVSCGYFDQAHFINDFREFSGLSPTIYLACKGDHQNHVPLLD